MLVPEPYRLARIEITYVILPDGSPDLSVHWDYEGQDLPMLLGILDMAHARIQRNNLHGDGKSDGEG